MEVATAESVLESKLYAGCYGLLTLTDRVAVCLLGVRNARDKSLLVENTDELVVRLRLCHSAAVHLCPG